MYHWIEANNLILGDGNDSLKFVKGGGFSGLHKPGRMTLGPDHRKYWLPAAQTEIISHVSKRRPSRH
jgi:hypothetical protein